MSKLYVFGCSYSGLHNIVLLNNPSMKKYYEFRGGNFPKTWSEILAKKMDLELVNLAEWGSDNYSIFERFCEISDKIKPDDIVIIGWSQTLRFRLYSEPLNSLSSLNVWDVNRNENFLDISKNTITEILVNRDNKLWVDEVYNWMKVIKQLSNLVGFKLYNWSFFSEFPDLYIIDDVLKFGAKYISDETNGYVDDQHFGEVGHQVQAQYFQNIINKML